MLSNSLCLLNPLVEQQNIGLIGRVHVQSLANSMLDLLVVDNIVLVDNGNGLAGFSGSCGPSYSMDVVLEVLGGVKVDDAVHIWNIETS